ncbi:MAG: hypothetical protein AAFX93_00285 [Verrucomicrobiota bacterium]
MNTKPSLSLNSEKRGFKRALVGLALLTLAIAPIAYLGARFFKHYATLSNWN